MLSNRQIFLRNVAQTSDAPLMLEIEKAEGVYLHDVSGKKYIDFISGISVSNVGHCHPKVVKAIHDQSQKFMHLMVYGEYIHSPQVLLSKALCETLPSTLSNVYLVNSGAEAIEGAMKLAKRYTGRTEIISCMNAYHGSTQGALSIMGSEFFKQAYRPLLPDCRNIRFNEIPDLSLITEQTAAVFIEVVQGEAGIIPAEKEYLQKLREKCTAMGTLLVFDEIQTGFGRTGSFWAFEQYGVVPDVLVCAKGMGGGMPIGAFIANESLMAVFKNEPFLGHITTFGGHPVSSAASLATLQLILEENLIAEVHSKALYIKERLKSPLIKTIRHKGLMMAVEFESFDVLKKIIDKAIDLGVITDWFLFCNNSMRICPPLTISYHELDEACHKINEAMA